MRANQIQPRMQALRTHMLTVYPDYASWTSLDKHAFAFGEYTPNKQVQFSAHTIEVTAKTQGASKPTATGIAVNLFNSFVPSQCPMGKKIFSTPGQTKNYQPKLHAGTFEIFNEDGSVNRNMLSRIERLADDCRLGVIRLSALETALNSRVGCNARVSGTRHNHNFFSREIEATANQFAWRAVFDMLVCRWHTKPNKSTELEPCVDPKMLSLFFIDTPICFQIATELGYPQPRPMMEKTSCFRCC